MELVNGGRSGGGHCLYLTGKGVMENKQKRALLLHAAGIDVQEIYFTLVSEEKVLLSRRR